MLLVLPKDMKDIPWEKAYPLSEASIGIQVTEKLIFCLYGIKDDCGRNFTIKRIMEKNKDIFGDEDFNKIIEDFQKLMETKVKRFFNGKSKYIFFDEIEQEKLDTICNSCALTAKLKIAVIGKEFKFREIDFENLSIKGFLKVKKYLGELGVIVSQSPEDYLNMFKRANKFNESMRDKTHPGIFDSEIKNIFKKFPSLKTKSKKEYKAAIRELCKKYHPDTSEEENAEKIFKEVQDAKEYLEDSLWFKTLPEDN